jgi:hypothetical protein
MKNEAARKGPGPRAASAASFSMILVTRATTGPLTLYLPAM